MTTQHDASAVERVARAILGLRVDRTDESWQRYRAPDSWMLFEEDARAALSAMTDPDALKGWQPIETRCERCGTSAPEAFASQCNRPECEYRKPQGDRHDPA